MPIGAIAALFFFTIRQMLRDAKFWVVGVVLLLPCGLVLTIRYFAPPIKSFEPLWQFYHAAVQFMFLLGLLPLACMIYGTGLIGAETESRTIGYLITRRLRRRTVLLTKFIATALVLAMLGAAALAALHALTVTGHDWVSLAAKSGALADWNPMYDLRVYLGVTALGVVGFLAIFSLIGVLTAKPLALSVIYMVIVELVISNLPVGARAYSLMHQLRLTAAGSIPRLTKLFQLPPELTQQFYPTGGSGVAGVLIVAGAALALGCVLVTIRELTPAKVARD
jgi:ABC-type transport system involved in multi-copper enzyme maturation permease subunit